MKKVCFVNTNKAWGGGEKWHLENAIKLKKDGFDVSLIVNRNSEILKKALENNLRVEEIKINNLSFLNIFKIIKIKKEFENENFDAILMNLPIDLKIFGIAAKMAKVKKIIYRRGMPNPIKNNLFNRFLFGKIIDVLITNSLEIKRSILKNNNKIISEEKIEILYNGIDIKKYEKMEYKEIFEKKKDEILIGNAGRLVEQKGQRYLIELAKKLKASKINFKILIAGTGVMEEKLKKMSKDENVDDKIVFLGFIENIKSFMMTIDIFVFTSLFEGSANTVLEAMMFKKPIVCFDVSSMPEMVNDNHNGYLVEAFDEDQLYIKVKDLIENKDKADNFGKNGFNDIKVLFNSEKSIKKLKEILE